MNQSLQTHQTKNHQAGFSVEIFFQMKCTFFTNATQVATLCTTRCTDIFYCCSLFSQFFLYFYAVSGASHQKMLLLLWA